MFGDHNCGDSGENTGVGKVKTTLGTSESIGENKELTGHFCGRVVRDLTMQVDRTTSGKPYNKIGDSEAGFE